jgi:Uma2 family endonuclease
MSTASFSSLSEILGPLARAARLVPSADFNLGEEDDYRVPDSGLHRTGSWGVRAPTAALVVEVVSPGDQTWEKLDFYAAHDVDELLIVDPQQRTVDWLRLVENRYRPVERSELIDVGPAEVAQRISWSAIEDPPPRTGSR